MWHNYKIKSLALGNACKVHFRKVVIRTVTKWWLHAEEILIFEIPTICSELNAQHTEFSLSLNKSLHKETKEKIKHEKQYQH